ncbi:MAG: MFS transporter, partial [Myxococcaceae bacterium]
MSFIHAVHGTAGNGARPSPVSAASTSLSHGLRLLLAASAGLSVASIYY